MKRMRDKYLKYFSTPEDYRLSDQIWFFIKAVHFMCLFILYPFACYGLFLSLKGLYLCDMNKLVDSGLVLNENLEMLFRGLTDITFLLILFPFILLGINSLWKQTIKNRKKELETEYRQLKK